ncbi:MAG TPA: ABC transporter permease [Sphingobium sp.]
MNSQVHVAFAGSGAPERPAGAPVQAFNIGALLQRLPAARTSFVIPAGILAIMLLCVLVPELVAPYGPLDMDAQALLSAPSSAHWFGTDHMGRDILSLIIHGARQSIMVAVSATLVALFVGGAIGLVTGYVGRWPDALFMRFFEIWLSVPDILLIIVIATALRPSMTNMVLTIGIVSAPRFTRVMRAQVIAIKHRPFVEAARAIGATDTDILLRHVLPHSLSPMLVLTTLGVGNAAQTGAMLSFIGIGLVADIPDWGAVLSQARSYLTVAWWFGAFPGLAITTLVIAVNLLGDALRQKLDPRGRAR